MISHCNALTEACRAWMIPGDLILDQHAEEATRVFDASQAEACPVVLPVRNEAHDLPAALWTLARSEFSVIPVVVDNGSTDNSGAIATAMGARVIHQPSGRKMAATQAGINYAREALRANMVLFSDGDTVFPRYWAGSMVEALHQAEGDKGAAVYGGSLYWDGRSRITDIARTALSFHEIRQRIKVGQPPKAKGVNYGIRFDANDTIQDTINDLDPDCFMHDDMMMRDAMLGVQAAVVGSLSLRSIVVTRGDRIDSLWQLLENRRGRGGHMNTAYSKEYGDGATVYERDTWI